MTDGPFLQEIEQPREAFQSSRCLSGWLLAEVPAAVSRHERRGSSKTLGNGSCPLEGAWFDTGHGEWILAAPARLSHLLRRACVWLEGSASPGLKRIPWNIPVWFSSFPLFNTTKEHYMYFFSFYWRLDSQSKYKPAHASSALFIQSITAAGFEVLSRKKYLVHFFQKGNSHWQLPFQDQI